MTTVLDKELRREVTIDCELYTVVLSGSGLRLVKKGNRKGYAITWRGVASGEAASRE